MNRQGVNDGGNARRLAEIAGEERKRCAEIFEVARGYGDRLDPQDVQRALASGISPEDFRSELLAAYGDR